MNWNFNQPSYKKIPILRLLIAIIVGILIQYHLKIKTTPFIVSGIGGIVLLMIYQFFSLNQKFKFSWLSGISASFIFVAIGGILSYTKNIEHQQTWIGKYYQSQPVKLTLQEPIAVKQKSYKALAKADAILINDIWQPVQGDVLLYFKKDSTLPNLEYGSQIVIASKLIPIINAGNPGGFNYAEYCKFQNISYQAFLKDEDFIIQPTKDKKFFNRFLISIRQSVLNILRNNIHAANELSVAEALLIGYRDDLDRDLVQSYSNTGVVHIIAISGLHLGMIYWLLLVLFKPFGKRKWVKWIKPIVVLLVLWIFTFIAGAAPSILRSAVMFTFIVVGESIGRKTNILNSLAASAFLLLIINPFSLWDVGFQLSYSAVLSIIIFHSTINKWIFIKNKLLQYVWSLTALSLSAQILTLPIVLYHFHQFPNYFLFTNLFAVPFSGLILFAALLLVIVGPIPYLANYIGLFTEKMVWVLNSFIEKTNNLPFAVWPSIQINIPQAIFLYASIAGFSIAFLQKKPKAILIGLSFLACFVGLRSMDFIKRKTQEKMIVYNVPNHTAIDLVQGRNYHFIGDDELTEDGFLRNFHIKPSRILHRIEPKDSLNNFFFSDNYIQHNNKRVFIIDNNFEIPQNFTPQKADVIIFTKNPKVNFKNLSTSFQCNEYVFDSSNPFWKIEKWQKDADSLHLHHHSTATQGAFVMEL